MSESDTHPAYAPFFGSMGAASAIVFSGSSYILSVLQSEVLLNCDYWDKFVGWTGVCGSSPCSGLIQESGLRISPTIPLYLPYFLSLLSSCSFLYLHALSLCASLLSSESVGSFSLKSELHLFRNWTKCRPTHSNRMQTKVMQVSIMSLLSTANSNNFCYRQYADNTQLYKGVTLKHDGAKSQNKGPCES